MTRIFELGPFRLDADAALLTRDGTLTPLGPRAIRVLGTLVAHAGDYVSKARLLDTAWPGVVVEESNLAVQVAAIRRVLAQAPVSLWDTWVPSFNSFFDSLSDP